MSTRWRQASAFGGPPLVVNEGGRRMYQHPVDGHLMPSVTACIGVLDKPALVGWAARETAKAAWQQRFALVRIDEQDAAVDLLKNARYRTTNAKAAVGTTVHAIAQALATDTRLPEFDDRHAPYADSFLAFCSDFSPEFVHVEATVFSDEHDYAGTLDFIARIGDRLLLGDHKTGKDIYPEVALQLAASRYADSIWDGLTGDLNPMPKVDGAIAVHLMPDGYRVRMIRADEDAFAAFVAARHLWPWVNGGSDGAVGVAMNLERLGKALSRAVCSRCRRREVTPGVLLCEPCAAQAAPTTIVPR